MLNISIRIFKLHNDIVNIMTKGTMSQIVDLGSSFYLKTGNFSRFHKP